MSDEAPRRLRVAVTRPAHTAEELAALLRAGDAEPVVLPLTRVETPLNEASLLGALERLDSFDWIVFTSANAVAAVARRRGGLTRPPGRVAAVGDATAAAVVETLGWRVHLVPETFSADALVPAMLQQTALAGARVLWPRAEASREVLRRDLLAAGASLEDPIAYRTLPDAANAAELRRRAAAGEIDVITFTAPSAVHSYVAGAGSIPRVRHAVIGATTADAARAAGLTVDIQPDSYTVQALAREVLARGWDG